MLVTLKTRYFFLSYHLLHCHRCHRNHHSAISQPVSAPLPPALNRGCEREVAEAEKGSSDELKSECIMRLSWALVHSKLPKDVHRGIAMLEDCTQLEAGVDPHENNRG
ncbi:Uncharacterized protein Fot_30998 [Forsythia ovata]|uniref:Uncharacterized protein n=1 Tax=Forsythia ovata TaxID=205694 RepID=A0ABD1T3R0_9LAMI